MNNNLILKNIPKTKSENLNTVLKKSAKQYFSKKVKPRFSGELNPVLKASSSWKIISSQLYDLLGKEIHTQWFKKIRPLTFSENMLILQTPNRASSLWINQNYQDLVDMLLSFQNENLSSFFMSPNDTLEIESTKDKGHHESISYRSSH